MESLFDWMRKHYARGVMGAAETLFDGLGFETAADNLRYYRSGRGGTRFFTDEQIAEHDLITEAEQEARTRFEGRTFTGRTGNKTINQHLLGLRAGETYTFEDHWDRDYGLSALLEPGTYAAFGRFDVESRGDFAARREGDRLHISGTVSHGFGRDNADRRFDFNPSQTGHLSASILEESGEAKPFDMRFDRTQDVSAELIYEPSGRLTLKRATWGAIR